MHANGYKVNQVQQAKILGFTIQSNLKHTKQINSTISNINSRLYNIKKLGTQTKIKSRTTLVKAIVIGKLNYAIALLSNSTQTQIQKLNTLIIKSCRVIMGNPCLRWTSARLLNKCRLHTVWHMITNQGLTYIHKIQTTQTPTLIYENYIIPNRPKRTNTNLRTKYTPKSKNSLFYRFSEIYSTLPDHLKTIEVKKFSKHIAAHITDNYDPYKFPNTNNTPDSDSE